jgi:WD40 repeat protein
LSAARGLPLAFRADASRLALGSPSRDLLLWDTSAPGRPSHVSDLRRGGGIVAAAWNPAAVSLLATVSTDGSVATWRILDDRPPQLTATMACPRDRPQHLAWLSGGKHLFTTTSLGRTTVWEADGTALAFRGRTVEGLVVAAFGWSGATALVSHVGHVELWDPATQFAKSRVLPGRVVAAAHSGALLAVAFDDGRVELVDRELERVTMIRLGSPAPVALAFSDDGQALVAAAGDGSPRPEPRPARHGVSRSTLIAISSAQKDRPPWSTTTR